MHRQSLFDSPVDLESLEIRIMPTAMLSAVVFAAPAETRTFVLTSDDHVDDSSMFRPSVLTAMNDLGDDPPITDPPLPPTGPLGPGSSV